MNKEDLYRKVYEIKNKKEITHDDLRTLENHLDNTAINMSEFMSETSVYYRDLLWNKFEHSNHNDRKQYENSEFLNFIIRKLDKQ
jgi:hypothetical protein